MKNNIYTLNNIPHLVVQYKKDMNFYIMIGPVAGYFNNQNYNLFIKITDKLCDVENSLFRDFLLKYKESGLIGVIHNSNFVIGTDWFLSKTYNASASTTVGLDILNEIEPMDDYYINELIFNYNSYVDISERNIKDLININYLNKINKEKNNLFSNDDIENFYSTFCKIILEMTSGYPDTQENMIYKTTLEYFANFKTNDTIKQLGLILRSNINNKYQGLGCNCIDPLNSNNIQMNSGIGTVSCLDLYKQSLDEYLYMMLGNYIFYSDWMFNHGESEETPSTPNIDMIDCLILLIDELKKKEYNLAFNQKTMHENCGCNLGSSENKCNYEILDNYILVLNYIKSGKVIENKNKIKVYGEAFGKLLPNLIF